MTTTSTKELHRTNDWRTVRKRILHQFSPATLLQNTAADCIVDASLRLQNELSLRAKSSEQEADDLTSGVPPVSSYFTWDRASIRYAIKYLATLMGECDNYPNLSENRKQGISNLFGEQFLAELTEWTVPNWEACMLAAHLTKHAQTFGRPLPPIPETATKVLPDPNQMKEMMLKLLHQKMCHLQEHLQFTNSKQYGLRPVSSDRESGGQE
jgi:hypothetical protein